MPETFGTGAAPTGWDAHAMPYAIAQVTVGGGATETISLPLTSLVAVCSVDVVSGGGGTGGFADFSLLIPSVVWWAINIGSEVDAFSWRGSLLVPPESGQGLVISNASDTSIDAVFSGLLFPQIPA